MMAQAQIDYNARYTWPREDAAIRVNSREGDLVVAADIVVTAFGSVLLTSENRQSKY